MNCIFDAFVAALASFPLLSLCSLWAYGKKAAIRLMGMRLTISEAINTLHAVSGDTV